jgi:hypothetical protein
MQKILPIADDEINTLKSYEGELSLLAEADKFFLLLMKVISLALLSDSDTGQVPAHVTRIDGCLMKIQFPHLLEDVRPGVLMLTEAVDGVSSNKDLHDMLLYVLEMGNFVNSGSFAGNAAGFSV